MANHYTLMYRWSGKKEDCPGDFYDSISTKSREELEEFFDKHDLKLWGWDHLEIEGDDGSSAYERMPPFEGQSFRSFLSEMIDRMEPPEDDEWDDEDE